MHTLFTLPLATSICPVGCGPQMKWNAGLGSISIADYMSNVCLFHHPSDPRRGCYEFMLPCGPGHLDIMIWWCSVAAARDEKHKYTMRLVYMMGYIAVG